MSNLYAERDIIEQGYHYSRHVSAMTSEGLHSKSAIAAELAHRDIQLEQAQTEINRLKQANFMKGDLAIEWKVKLDKAQARVAELEKCLSVAHQILDDQGATGSIMGRFRKALAGDAEQTGGGR